MGLSYPAYLPVLIALQVGSIGVVTIGLVQQHQLRQEVLELSGRIHDRWAHREELRGGGGGGPDPSPSTGASLVEPSKGPQIGHQGYWNLGHFLWLGLDWVGTYSLLAFLVLAVVVLAALRCWNRFQHGDPVGGLSPLSPRDLAQQQLAELRLRRHGLGK